MQQTVRLHTADKSSEPSAEQHLSPDQSVDDVLQSKHLGLLMTHGILLVVSKSNNNKITIISIRMFWYHISLKTTLG